MPRKTKSAARPRPLLQGLMAVIGLVVTLGAIGVVAWEAMQPPAPPLLSARIVQVQPTASGQVATVRINNDGPDTAAQVQVEGVLGDEVATATVAYVPRRGHAEAYLRFDGDARQARVSVRGWSAP
ncbi:hypothetical protein E4M02_00410 [Brevundimonas sp. S30B]|uniref:hypothetical protein n=1 Tax=unclassified Brevundimonas TaxID=2622653 RepID=UPI001071B2C2|nr:MULTISPECIES: hypothetical protein [unclassified Brevundimonas]QBX37613.1 hypothetical protein E4M01_07410 [Brevundimonas sp. MF30-B]TFW03594.1 hypothetical protein E4M02_00410 [Brevundimonas sp. S30B]